MNVRFVINKGITLLATIGVVIIIGTIGNVDYLTTIGQDCNMVETIKCTVLGIFMIMPAVIREVTTYIG